MGRAGPLKISSDLNIQGEAPINNEEIDGGFPVAVGARDVSQRNPPVDSSEGARVLEGVWGDMLKSPPRTKGMLICVMRQKTSRMMSTFAPVYPRASQK